MGKLLLAITIVSAIVFTSFPGIDLWMSGLFYRTDDGFHLQNAWWAVAIYEAIPFIAFGIGAGAVLLLVLNLLRKRKVGSLSNRFLLFVVAALAIGPGLVVNVGFKNNWGRARPREVTEFAGAREFTPALVPTHQCERNCSFVAGHPSVMFWLAALGYAAATRKRRHLVFAAAAALGLIAGLGRIVQGAHFLSDVVFSGISVFTVVWLLARWFRLDEDPRAVTGE